jgi:hypothetical protein
MATALSGHVLVKCQHAHTEPWAWHSCAYFYELAKRPMSATIGPRATDTAKMVKPIGGFTMRVRQTRSSSAREIAPMVAAESSMIASSTLAAWASGLSRVYTCDAMTMRSATNTPVTDDVQAMVTASLARDSELSADASR